MNIMYLKIKIFALVCFTMVGLVSCSDMDWISEGDGESIEIEVTDEVAKNATKAGYEGFPVTVFETGDQIGVYAVNSSNSVISSNVAFTREDDGSWTPASPVVYNPDYKYYAYFPYKASVPSFSASGNGADGKFTNFLNSSTFWLADQSTKEKFTTSNLMWAEGVVTGKKTIRFTMSHKRGLAIIGAAKNKWYYTDAAGTKYELSQVFTGNIPYTIGDKRYFLLKPDVSTDVGGLTLRAGAGKYMISEGGEISGSIDSWSYRTSSNLGSSWSSWTSSKPSWLTVTTQNTEGEPTEFLVTTTNSTSTTTLKQDGYSVREVEGDAILKAANPVSNVDLSMVDNAGNPRGSRTTANCYLVHAAGTYKIPLVYGNAIKNGDETSTAAFCTTETSNTIQRLVNHNDEGITTPWIKNQIGACPNGAKLVWEDVKGAISNVGIDTSDNGYITFTVDNDNIAEGNAVVAATLDGVIVWSWHIWMTPETLSDFGTVDTGSHIYKVAPVNVGQVTGKIVENCKLYAGDLCEVKATANGVTMLFQVAAKDYVYGGRTYYNPSPYYQWGRKDAMYPCIGAYDSDGIFVNSYTSGSTLITDGSVTTPGSTIQHPDYWYYNSSNYGPYGTNSSYAGKYNYWDMNNTKTDNVTTATVKTIYDPCPPGVCVPTGNLYYYMGKNGSYTTWQNTPAGRTWNKDAVSLFFPASGYRYYSNGSLDYVGSYGYYWSASPSNSYTGRYLYFTSDDWYWSTNYRAYGFPVRVALEE